MVLDGHAVAEAQVGWEKDTWWILDPDFGVVLENNMNFVEDHPEIVIEKYTDAGNDSKTAKMIAELY